MAPLSQSQARLWFLQRLQPDSITYNESGVWHFDVDLDSDALRDALVLVAKRQTMLRTRFPVVQGSGVQVVDAAADIEFECIDMGADATDVELDAVVLERARRPFELAARPALRTILYRRGPRRCTYQRVWHHIMCDGLSAGVLNREFSRAYSAVLARERIALPPLGVDYAAFTRRRAAELASPQGAADLAYWTQRLADAPVLSLPTDFERPAVQSHRGGVVHGHFDLDTVASIRDLARQADASTLLTLFTAYCALLSRLSGDETLLVGIPVSGRTRDVEDVIGFFATTLVHRADFNGGPTVLEAIGRTGDSVREALAHQKTPFEALVNALPSARDRSRNPLFQVAFSMRRGESSELTLGGAHAHRVGTEIGESRFDLTLMIVERVDGCRLRWEYCADLFEHATIERMSHQFAALLRAMVRAPGTAIGTCALMDEPTRDETIRRGIGAVRSYPGSETVHRRFERQAAATPTARAIGGLDYAQLDACSNRLAALLRSEGVRQGTFVAVACGGAEALVTAWLAVLKAGAAYVPIVADVPNDRVKVMLDQAGVECMVIDEAFADPAIAHGRSTVDLVRDADRIAGQSTAPIGEPVTPDSAAYAMFTSGSTGQPKGVVVSHRAIMRLVCNTDFVQLGANDVVAQLASPAFDASTFEVWAGLLNGARIAPIPRTDAITPRVLADRIASERISVMFLTTALFNLVAREVPDAFRRCATVLFGGEAVEPRWVRAILAEAPPRRLLHVYGPTETTTFATWHEVREVPLRASTIPIGKPVANSEVFVLRDDLEPAAPGEVGMIHVGGPGLALGYLQPAENAAFIVAPAGTNAQRRLYRTGDRARTRDDGAIEFLGRVDEQVKVRGHRIELGEIRAAFLRTTGVKDALALVRGASSDSRQIVAYAVAAAPGPQPVEAVWAELRRSLPPYARPAAIVWMDALPLNTNGKVDRRALPAPSREDGQPVAPQRIAHVGMLEVQLTRIVENLLRRKDVKLHDRFFDLGGHSLLAARLVDVIEVATGVAIPLTALFSDDSIAGLASAVRAAATAPSEPLFTMNARGTRPPFVFLHGDFSGGGFYSRTLAHALGDEQPLVIVHPHGLTGPEIPSTIEAMAADRLHTLRRERPHGPYIVGGHCNGAFVALEMARMLRAQGESVPAVVIVDAPSPRAPDEPAAPADAAIMTRDQDGSVRQLDPADPKSAAQMTYFRAMNRYTGGRCDAHLVIVSSGREGAELHDMRWARLATSSERHVLPGNHVTLVTRHVRLLAKVVSEAITRRLRNGAEHDR